MVLNDQDLDSSGDRFAAGFGLRVAQRRYVLPSGVTPQQFTFSLQNRSHGRRWLLVDGFLGATVNRMFIQSALLTRNATEPAPPDRRQDTEGHQAKTA